MVAFAGMRSPALGIPKSAVSELFGDGGQRVDQDKYKASNELGNIRWIKGKRPSAVTAQIKIGGRLWTSRALAIISALSAIVVALISHGNEYFNIWDGETAALTDATFHNWVIDPDKKQVSFNLAVGPIDKTKYVKASDLGKYKLVFALRPWTSAGDLSEGVVYDYAKEYPFESSSSSEYSVALSDKQTLSDAATNCIKLVLFRVASQQLTNVPLKTHFEPKSYSPEIKVLQSEASGGKC